MMIGVMVRDAIGVGTTVVVPLDTDYVMPEEHAIRTACAKELKSLYPLHAIDKMFGIMMLDDVMSKIDACRKHLCSKGQFE